MVKGTHLEERMANGGVALQRHSHRQVHGPGEPDVHQGQQQGDQLFEDPGQVQPDTKAQYHESQVGCLHTDEKENEIFLMYKEIQMGAVAKSYMRKGLLILYMRKCANI